MNLIKATSNNNIEEVSKLLNKEIYQELIAEVNFKALDDWTPLHMACFENYFQIVEILLNHDSDIEAKTSIGRTPLHLASFRGHQQIIEILVNKGANINACDVDGNTPLHYLSQNGHIDEIKYFICRNPDFTIKNLLGKRAIDVAPNIEIFDVKITRS